MNQFLTKTVAAKTKRNFIYPPIEESTQMKLFLNYKTKQTGMLTISQIVCRYDSRKLQYIYVDITH